MGVCASLAACLCFLVCLCLLCFEANKYDDDDDDHRLVYPELEWTVPVVFTLQPRSITAGRSGSGLVVSASDSGHRGRPERRMEFQTSGICWRGMLAGRSWKQTTVVNRSTRVGSGSWNLTVIPGPGENSVFANWRCTWVWIICRGFWNASNGRETLE